MGGVVSTGENNDDLIDNLKEAEYIKTKKVEQVFRIVDRAHYYLPECRDGAYKDCAWKSGTLHLSAPCIYSEVMEALELERGLSFLNLGSGTGYLSTMVGFMIGPHGINHGIELHEENVKHAEERLEDFKQTAKKFNDLEFCEPAFIQGNCLHLAPDIRRYDRVYCGAACPPDLKSTLQNLIKLNGILVMPVGDQLVKVKRISEKEFVAENMLPVSFASLYVPDNQESVNLISPPEVNPVSLRNQCAAVVRESIRRNFCFDTPGPLEVSMKENKKTKRIFQPENVRVPFNCLPATHRLMIMSAFGHHTDDDSDDSDDDEADDSILDLELQRYAEVRHREEERKRQEEEKAKTDEVDSSLSDEEMTEEEDQKEKIVSSSSFITTLRSVSEDVGFVDSEDGVVADDEEDEDIGFEEGSKAASQKNGNGPNKRALQTSKISKSVKKRVENVNNSKLSRKERASSILEGNDKLSKPDLYLSSDEDDQMVTNSGMSSGPIQMVTSSYTRGQKTSYSTSAEASETSGFGSLGEDVFHAGSLPSSSVFLDLDDDNSGDDIADKSYTSSGMNEQSCPDAIRSELQEHTTIEEEKMDETEDTESENDESPSATNQRIDIISDEESTQNSEDDAAADIKKKRIGLTEPRGPDFTAFLKVQVETLPIPNALKQFITNFR